MSLLVGPVSTGALLFDFWRPITLLSPKNMPGTHQYAVRLVAQIVAQIFGVFLKSLLVDKVSWYMKFFLILPNKYYTFVTSPFLSPSPSPAPFCSIFGSPKRLDLWLGLCLGLFLRFLGCFRCHFWSAQCPPAPFCSIFGGRSPSYHQKTCPEPTNMRSHLWRKLWRRFWGCFGGHFWSTKCHGI